MPNVRAMYAAPATPPAGPESASDAPFDAASAAGAVPPLDDMTLGAGKPGSLEPRCEVRDVATDARANVGLADRRRACARTRGSPAGRRSSRRRRTSADRARSASASAAPALVRLDSA